MNRKVVRDLIPVNKALDGYVNKQKSTEKLPCLLFMLESDKDFVVFVKL